MSEDAIKAGALGRLGVAMHRRFRWVVGLWLLVIVIFGAMAPKVFDSLAGAGWQANDSESVKVRELAIENFGGNASSAVQVVLDSDKAIFDEQGTPTAEARAIIDGIRGELKGDDRFAKIVDPQLGMTIEDGDRTMGIVLAGAGENASTDDMVKAVDDHKKALTALSADGIDVFPTGASALWSDFNKANLDAMMKAEMISWPVTMIIMIIAFGSLVAAGLPLLLTLAGLVVSAGALVLLNAVTPISVWAMNFAMMFALALGIDYALFIVVRFRDAINAGSKSAKAVAETMDTAGKAVLLSGITVLISLSAVLVVPAPAVRTMAVGIMLAVTFVLAATLTLLPAVLGKLGPRINKGRLPGAKDVDKKVTRFHQWGQIINDHPAPFGIAAILVTVALALPVFGLKVAMPSINVVPEDAPVRQGYHVVQEKMGEGAPGMLQIVVDRADAAETARIAQGIDGVAKVGPTMPAMPGVPEDLAVDELQAMARVASASAKGELPDFTKLPEGIANVMRMDGGAGAMLAIGEAMEAGRNPDLAKVPAATQRKLQAMMGDPQAMQQMQRYMGTAEGKAIMAFMRSDDGRVVVRLMDRSKDLADIMMSDKGTAMMTMMSDPQMQDMVQGAFVLGDRVVMPIAADGDSDKVMLMAEPTVDPSDEKMGAILDQLRADLPGSALVGGAPAENLDLQTALDDYLPIVMGIILVLGFLLLLIALQAPVIAFAGTLISLLSTGAAFGVAKLIFQDGHGASLLGFEPQGFLDGWGPVFFFAMIFAIAMDYTVFLLSVAKEHYEMHSDPRRAQIDAMGHSGRVIFAAAAVMVAVFFTFALADPLPPKEMGIILGVAVLIDAVLIRLILLPVALRVLGHKAWWVPGPLGRILPDIKFSHG